MDDAFCDALLDWGGLVEEAAVVMDELGAALSDAETVADLPTSDELHRLGQEIVAKASEADAAIATVVANITDPEVAETIEAGHDIFFELALGMGEAARDDESLRGCHLR